MDFLLTGYCEGGLSSKQSKSRLLQISYLVDWSQFAKFSTRFTVIKARKVEGPTAMSS